MAFPEICDDGIIDKAFCFREITCGRQSVAYVVKQGAATSVKSIFLGIIRNVMNPSRALCLCNFLAWDYFFFYPQPKTNQIKLISKSTLLVAEAIVAITPSHLPPIL